MEEMIQTTGEPKKTKKTLRVEDWLYLLAFGLAMVMRLVLLNGTLTEWEAGFVWQAYQVSRGVSVELFSHPGYILPTGLLFYLFGSGEVLARLLPALVGSAVVLLPYNFRDGIGRKAALIAAFGLAFDPLMVAYARQAGSPAMALGFAALMLFCYRKEKPFLAGLFAGLVLLSGPSLIFGLLTLLGGLALQQFVSSRSLALSMERNQWLTGLAGAAFSLFVFGTLLMRYPEGLSAIFQAIPDYFAGIFRGSSAEDGAPLVQVLAAIVVYQPLAVLFAFFGVAKQRSEQQDIIVFLLGSLAAGLLLLSIDPSRQVWMLLWLIVPLWLLAGKAIAPFISLPAPEDRPLVWGETAFFFVILLYWWFNITKMTSIFGINIPEGVSLWQFSALDAATRVYLVRMLVTVFIPLLIVLVTALASRVWDGPGPMQGAYWSVGAFLAIYLLMTAWNFTAQPTELAGELWVQGPSAGHADELIAAIEEASLQVTGTQNELELVYQIDSPLIRWLLRDFPNARYSAVPLENELSEAVLNRETGNGDDLLSQFYLGERITLNLTRNWAGRALPPDFDRWLVYRESPVEKDWVTFWRRADLFPLYSPESSDTGTE